MLLKLEEKAQYEGTPELIKEEFITKVREYISHIDQTKIEKTVDKIYGQMMEKKKQFEEFKEQIPEIPEMQQIANYQPGDTKNTRLFLNFQKQKK